MNATTTGLVHRLRQARTVVLRAQLAVTGAQILFWLGLVGVLLGLVLRMRHRGTRREPPSIGDAPPLAPDGEAPKLAVPDQ